jgi:bacillithiol system protein YtxJ
MNWISLTHEDQLAELKQTSRTRPQVIFKHSTRCSLSTMAKNRLEKATPPEMTDFYFLDLIKYRELSNRIADEFDVIHESPQVLLIRDAACIYEESHSAIQMDELAEQISLN